MRWHPDRNPADLTSASDRMRAINDAYAVLGNPARRRAYDASQSPPELMTLEAAYEGRVCIAVTTHRFRYADEVGRVVDVPRDSITCARARCDPVRGSAATLIVSTSLREHRLRLPTRIACAFAAALS